MKGLARGFARAFAPMACALLFGSASNLGLYNLMSTAPLYDAVKDFVHVASLGGTPPAVVDTLAKATAKVLGDATLIEQLAKLGIQPTAESSPAAATAYIRAEIEKWRPVVEATGIKIQ